MSSLQENYDKATIGVGAFALIALGALGLGKELGLSEKLGLSEPLEIYAPADSKVQAIPGLESSQKVIQSVEQGHKISLDPVGEQTYYLFVGPSLWLRKGSDRPVALYSGDALHPPVDNRWFMDRGMEATMRKADALQADDDGDGFTNLEEFDGGTDPVKAENHPPLVEKLRVAGIEESKMYLKLSLPEQGKTGIQALRGRRVSWQFRDLKPGDKFGPPDDPERFELKAVEKRTQEQGSLKLEDWRADFQDLSKPNKPTLELFRRNKFITIVDKTVEFTLLAGKEKGQRFKVQEGQRFSLPPGGAPQFQLLTADKRSPEAVLLDLKDKKEIKIK